jgi:hypothetical protein
MKGMEPCRAALGVLRTAILPIFPQHVDGMNFMHDVGLDASIVARLPGVVT